MGETLLYAVSDSAPDEVERLASRSLRVSSGDRLLLWADSWSEAEPFVAAAPEGVYGAVIIPGPGFSIRVDAYGFYIFSLSSFSTTEPGLFLSMLSLLRENESSQAMVASLSQRAKHLDAQLMGLQSDRDAIVRAILREGEQRTAVNDVAAIAYDIVGDAVTVHDIDSGLIINGNLSAWRLAGGVGQIGSWLGCEAVWEPFMACLDRQVRESTSPVEWKHVDAVGNVMWLEATYRIVKLLDNEVVVVVTRDATQRRLESANARRAKQVENIKEVARFVADRFNNSLQNAHLVLNKALELVSSNSDEAGHLRQVKGILQDSQHVCQRLIVYSGDNNDACSPQSVNTIVEQYLNKFYHENIEVVLDVNLEQTLPKVMSSSRAVGEILENLVRNALESFDITLLSMARTNYVASDTVWISTECCELDCAQLRALINGRDCAPGRYVVLRVLDNGCGIDPDGLEKLFDIFYTTKSGVHGGFGLSAVLGLVKSQNGALSVSSQWGKGSEFAVYLPATESDESAIESKPVAALPNGGDARRTPKRFLVAEDEVTQVREMRSILEGWGHEVVTAVNGRDALIEYEASKKNGASIDMVITDIRMAGLNGFELCAQLHKDNPALPLLVVSGYAGNYERIEFGKIGAKVIGKPFTPDSISKAITAVFNYCNCNS